MPTLENLRKTDIVLDVEVEGFMHTSGKADYCDCNCECDCTDPCFC